MARQGRSRLSIDLPTPIYEQLKLISKRRNLTLTRVLIMLIVGEMQKERNLE